MHCALAQPQMANYIDLADCLVEHKTEYFDLSDRREFLPITAGPQQSCNTDSDQSAVFAIAGGQIIGSVSFTDH